MNTKVTQTRHVRKSRPSICTGSIAAALIACTLGHASAETFSTPFGTQAFSGILAGPDLIMNGGGFLRLAGPQSNLTGNITLNAGSVAITDAGALGSGTSPVVITSLPLNGLFFDTTRGGGGGNLTVGGGITLSRSLNLRGNGPSGQGGALTSVGDNLFSGTITATASTALLSTYGTTTLSGPFSWPGARRQFSAEMRTGCSAEPSAPPRARSARRAAARSS